MSARQMLARPHASSLSAGASGKNGIMRILRPASRTRRAIRLSAGLQSPHGHNREKYDDLQHDWLCERHARTRRGLGHRRRERVGRIAHGELALSRSELPHAGRRARLRTDAARNADEQAVARQGRYPYQPATQRAVGQRGLAQSRCADATGAARTHGAVDVPGSGPSAHRRNSALARRAGRKRRRAGSAARRGARVRQAGDHRSDRRACAAKARNWRPC